MALIKRVSRLISADVHAVLDHIEEPEAVLQQAIREMNDQVGRLGGQARWKEAQHREAEKRLGNVHARIADVDEKLDLCFADGDEDLARRLVRRKLELKRLGDDVRSTIDRLEEELESLTARLERQRDELEGMRQKASVFIGRHDGDRDAFDPATTVDDTEVEAALLAERQARQPS